MSRATPGPWRAEFDEHSGYDCMTSAYIIRRESSLVRVAVVDVADYLNRHEDYDAAHAEHPVAAANARLIAAAPDLRDALEGLMNYADDPPCEASLTGSCDKGYHNDHGAAIVAARAVLKACQP